VIFEFLQPADKVDLKWKHFLVNS